MKALTCEMCGSANIVKEGDFYVCQSCGTKFAAEKKPKETATQAVQQPVVLTGNVKIDASSDIEKLYENYSGKVTHMYDHADGQEHQAKFLH